MDEKLKTEVEGIFDWAMRGLEWALRNVSEARKEGLPIEERKESHRPK